MKKYLALVVALLFVVVLHHKRERVEFDPPEKENVATVKEGSSLNVDLRPKANLNASRTENKKTIRSTVNSEPLGAAKAEISVAQKAGEQTAPSVEPSNGATLSAPPLELQHAASDFSQARQAILDSLDLNSNQITAVQEIENANAEAIKQARASNQNTRSVQEQIQSQYTAAMEKIMGPEIYARYNAELAPYKQQVANVVRSMASQPQ